MIRAVGSGSAARPQLVHACVRAGSEGQGTTEDTATYPQPPPAGGGAHGGVIAVVVVVHPMRPAGVAVAVGR